MGQLRSEDILLMLWLWVGLQILLVLALLIGYVLTSLALARIAKREGAQQKVVRRAWIPFARYDTLGKLTERCDARRGKELRLKSRAVTITGWATMPLAVALYVVGSVMLFVPLITLLISITPALDPIATSIENLLDVLGYDLLAVIIILLMMPVGELLRSAAGVLALPSTVLFYVCYAKILREHFKSPWCWALVVISVLFGIFPITLLIASLKKPLPAVAYSYEQL